MKTTRGVATGYFISLLQRENRALPHGRATAPLAQSTMFTQPAQVINLRYNRY